MRKICPALCPHCRLEGGRETGGSAVAAEDLGGFGFGATVFETNWTKDKQFRAPQSSLRPRNTPGSVRGVGHIHRCRIRGTQVGRWTAPRSA